jgi:hypothetical protein
MGSFECRAFRRLLKIHSSDVKLNPSPVDLSPSAALRVNSAKNLSMKGGIPPL